MSNTRRNRALLRIAGTASLAIALLYVGCAIAGGESYYWFGTGMELSKLAARGSPWPPVVALAVAVAFVLFALYPWSATGVGPRVPRLRTGLVIITGLYLLRGVPLARVLLARPIFPAAPEHRYVVFTIVVFAVGLVHLAAVISSWRSLERA